MLQQRKTFIEGGIGVKSEINDTVLIMAQQSTRKLAKTTLEKLAEHVYEPELQLLRIPCCLATGSKTIIFKYLV